MEHSSRVCGRWARVGLSAWYGMALATSWHMVRGSISLICTNFLPALSRTLLPSPNLQATAVSCCDHYF